MGLERASQGVSTALLIREYSSSKRLSDAVDILTVHKLMSCLSLLDGIKFPGLLPSIAYKAYHPRR